MTSKGKTPDQGGNTGSGAASGSIAQRARALKDRAAAVVAEHQAAEAGAIISELRSIDDSVLAAADIAVARDIMDTAGILLQTGQFATLEPLFVKIAQVLGNHRQAATVDRFAPLNNLAALYDAKGDHRSRDMLNSTIVAMADQLTAPLDATTSTMFAQLATLYDQHGHPRAAAILYRQLHRHIMASEGFGAETRLALTGKYANALAADGQLGAAISMCDQSLSALESRGDLAGDHRLQLLGLTAHLLQRNGNLDQAQSMLERARDTAGQTGHGESRAAGVVYHNLASLYLHHSQREHYDEAERLLESARKIVAKNGPHESSEYAGEVAQLATVVKAKGEFERADALYREAFRLYEAAPDTNPRDFADFLTDAGFLYLGHGRPEDAVGVFERARTVRESLRNLDPLQHATALSNLATALFESRDFANAIHYYRRAIEIRHQSPEFIARN